MPFDPMVPEVAMLFISPAARVHELSSFASQPWAADQSHVWQQVCKIAFGQRSTSC